MSRKPTRAAPEQVVWAPDAVRVTVSSDGTVDARTIRARRGRTSALNGVRAERASAFRDFVVPLIENIWRRVFAGPQGFWDLEIGAELPDPGKRPGAADEVLRHAELNLEDHLRRVLSDPLSNAITTCEFAAEPGPAVYRFFVAVTVARSSVARTADECIIDSSTSDGSAVGGGGVLEGQSSGAGDCDRVDAGANAAGDLETLAASYRAAVAAADDRRRAAAADLGPAFRALVKRSPQATYREKQELGRWINGELRPRGLALKCPKTGQATLLLTDTGEDPEVGRFQFFYSARGKTVRTVSRTVLPDLEIVPAALEHDIGEPAVGEWTAAEKRRAGSETSRGKG